MNTSKPTLILLRGLPGSGKSTFANFLEKNIKEFNCVHFEADQFFIDSFGHYEFDATYLQDAHAWCQGKCRVHLKSGMDVVVSNTNTTEREVKFYQKIAEDCSANFVSLIVENRHEGKNIHNVPADVISKMHNRFSIKL